MKNRAPAERRAKDLVQNLLRRTGYQFTRVEPPDLRYERPSFDPSRDLPPDAHKELRADHPRLAQREVDDTVGAVDMATTPADGRCGDRVERLGDGFVGHGWPFVVPLREADITAPE